MQRSTVRPVGATVHLLSALCFALLGCGGGDGGSGPQGGGVASITVALASTSITVGQQTTATATARDAQGAVVQGATISWSSSNSSIASVTQLGQVSGVAPGSTNIVATSGSITGQAGLQVAPVPAIEIGDLSLITTTGQPLDTANVAGPIALTTDVTLPAGFKGVREIKIGGVSFYKDSVFGPGGTFARLAPSRVDFETAQAVTSITADEIQSTALKLNGRWPLDLSISGTVGTAPVSQSSQTFVTLRNNDALRFFVKPERSAVLVDGRRIASGQIDAFVDYVSFSGKELERIEVLSGNGQAVYGSDAIGGVLNIVTRSGQDVHKRFTVPANLFNVESPAAGTRFIVGEFTAGGVTYNPQQQYFSESGNVTSVDGSGWATSPSAASSITLSAGLKYQYTVPPASGSIPDGYIDASSISIGFDNLAPRALAGAVTPPSRQLTVGQPAFGQGWKLGITANYLGQNTDLADFVNPDLFEDFGAGLGDDPTYTFYASTVRSNLFNEGSAISSLSSLSASNNRVYYLGVSVSDLVGNVAQYAVKTNSANPYGPGGSIVSPSLFGVADATFGKLDNGGSIVSGGIASGSVFNNSSLGSLQITARATGSFYTQNAGFGVTYDYADRTKCYIGYGEDCKQGEVFPTLVSGSGDQADLNLSLATLFARRAAVEGGSGEGAIAGAYQIADMGGNKASGGYGYMEPFYALWDRTPPVTSISTTFTAPGQIEVTLRGTDNIGIERFEVGARFAWPNGLFYGGDLYIPMYEAPLGGDFAQGLSTDISTTIPGAYPTTGRFFDRASGQITSTAFPTSGIYARFHDWARNASTPTFVSVPSQGGIEPAPSNLNITFGSSASSVCGGVTCGGGQPNIVDLIFTAISPDANPPFEKIKFSSIWSDTRVRGLGDVETPTITDVQGGKRYEFRLSLDAAKLCLPTGFHNVKVAAPYRDGKQVFFPNSFVALNVVAPSTPNPECTLPRRSLFTWSTWQ